MERRQEINLISWQTRQLSTFTAGGYMTDGKSNPAMDYATTLAFDKIEAEQIKEAAALQEDRDNPTSTKFDEDGNVLYEGPEPKVGSHERFLGSFGNPMQWAGR